MSFTSRTPLNKEVLDGISEPTLKKLRDAGIETLEHLSTTPPRTVMEIAGVGKDVAEKYTRQAQILLGGYKKASEYLQVESSKPKISTGSRNLDNILKGGIKTGEITEVISEWGGGKTQLCFTLAITVQQSPFEGETLVIDSENTFSTERLKEIAQSRGMDVNEALNHIMIAKAYNSAHEELLVKDIPSQINKNPKIKLIIVDSIIGHFRQEYIGRGTLADRQGHLGVILSMLLRVAQAYDVAVVITNQQISSPDVMYGNPNKPAGGNIVAHAGTQRITLRKGRKNVRIASIIDSPNLPPSEATFIINEMGITDAGEEKEKEAEEDV